MQDFPNIPDGSVKKTDAYKSNVSRQDYYPPQSKGKKSASAKVHKGEIVHGTILETPNTKQAVVKLPTGVFRAYLDGSLRQGDSLFFKIAETSPSLVLKIYAAAIGKSGSNNEKPEQVIRMLNLPRREFYTELIKWLRDFQSTISRDELTAMYNNFTLLNKEDIKKAGAPHIFRMLFFMQELGLPFSRVAFLRLLPVFLGQQALRQRLKRLEESIKNLPEDYREKTAALFNKLRDTKTPLSYLIRSFSLDMSSELYKLLSEITSKYARSESPMIYEASTAAGDILDTIESQAVYNAIARYGNMPFYVYLPFVINDSLQIVQMKIMKEAAGARGKESARFSFSAPAGSLGEIDTQGSVFDNILSIKLLAETDEAVNALREKKGTLENSLRSMNFDLRAVTIQKRSYDGDEFINDLARSRQQNFTVVV